MSIGWCNECGRTYQGIHHNWCKLQYVRAASPPVANKAAPVAPTNSKAPISLAVLAAAAPRPAMPTGIAALDELLGGGLVPGATVLLESAVGAGATTMALQIADAVARGGDDRWVLLAAAEHSDADLGILANRLKLSNDRVMCKCEADVYAIVRITQRMKPALVIIDSIDTASVDDIDDDVGTAEQFKAVGNYMTSFGKATGTSVLLLAHPTQTVASITHLVDVHLRLDHLTDHVASGEAEESDLSLRVLQSAKNRFKADGGIAGLCMTPLGLRPLDPGMEPRIVFASAGSRRYPVR